MGTDDGGVDQRHGMRGLGGQSLEDLDPDTGTGPAVEAIVDRRIGPVAFGQIAPWRTSAQHVEDTVDDAAVVNSRHAERLVGEEWLDQLPLPIAQIEARHSNPPVTMVPVQE